MSRSLKPVSEAVNIRASRNRPRSSWYARMEASSLIVEYHLPRLARLISFRLSSLRSGRHHRDKPGRGPQSLPQPPKWRPRRGEPLQDRPNAPKRSPIAETDRSLDKVGCEAIIARHFLLNPAVRAGQRVEPGPVVHCIDESPRPRGVDGIEPVGGSHYLGSPESVVGHFDQGESHGAELPVPGDSVIVGVDAVGDLLRPAIPLEGVRPRDLVSAASILDKRREREDLAWTPPATDRQPAG